jgi:glycosyltransferase 2 family protein
MRSHLRTGIVVALAIGLLALFLRNANLAGVWTEIMRGRLLLLGLALVTTMTTYALRARRWQCLLAGIGPTRFVTAFRATVIGFAASFLLPARAGEFLRPFLLARREGLSATAAFATIILERLLDTVTVLLFFATYLLLFDPGVEAADPKTFQAVKLGGFVATVAAVVALGVVFFLAGHPAAIGHASLGIERVLPARLARKVARLVQMFAEGLAAVRQPRRLVATMLWSVPLWLSIATGIWLVSRAFHIEIPFTGSFLLMALLVVGVAVPTPGAIGGFHIFYQIGAMSFFGAPNDRAVGAAIVLHAISFVPVTLVGIVFMAQEGLSLGRMRSLAGMAGAEEAAE